MGVFDAIFGMTAAGKITTSTCKMINVIRRLNPSLSDVEVALQTVAERFGKESDITKIIVGNLYFLKFSYDPDDSGEDDVKFGLMDLVVYIVYFEVGPRAFDDRYLIGKIGQRMREEGFTSKEINGRTYQEDEFPVTYYRKYVVGQSIDTLDLNWRIWM